MIGGNFTLLHSPLVGPATWRPAAEALRRLGGFVWEMEIDAAGLSEPADEAFARQVAEQLPSDGYLNRGVLVPHSAAGFFVQTLALESSPVIFVDALLPSPGQSWFDAAPGPLAAHISRLATAGALPPWPEWFGASTMARLVPDDDVRAAFVAECRPIPMRMLTAKTSETPLAGRHGYLQLSEAYAEEAQTAERRGWLVRREPMHHLAMLSEPDTIARILLEMEEALR